MSLTGFMAVALSRRGYCTMAFAVAVTTSTLLWPTESHALIFFADRSAWEAAVGGNFEEVDIAGQLAEFAILPAGNPLLLPFDETLAFDITLQRLQVPSSWATWSGGKTPAVLYTQGADSLTATFGPGPVAAFGLEIEPNLFAVLNVTLTTINGGTHTLTQTVNGFGGAKFFGWTEGSVVSMQLTCTGGCLGFGFGEMVKAEGVVMVMIDIHPGSFPNSINPRSQGVIPVAILTTASFDATTVDPSTVFFGATGAEAAAVQFALEDVDGDGDLDLILHFRTQDTGIQCGQTSASLTGKTFSGQAIQGSDSIVTVGCK
jgi:hypothetical protein